MKIALVRQAPTYADWYKQPMFGLGYICSYLEKNGFTCRIFDAYFFRRTQEELYREIIDYNPDVIGISAMTYQVTSAAQLASKIKKKGSFAFSVRILGLIIHNAGEFSTKSIQHPCSHKPFV